MHIEFNFPEKKIEHCFTEVFYTEEVLTPGEREGLKGISVKRRRDFSTGRYCAREALKALGMSGTEILSGPKNEPLWPQGFVGSISHSEGLAGAIVASSSNFLSLGLDIEKTGGVKAGMWDILFRPEEQEFLNALSHEEQAFFSTLFFSMKESFYKLQYPLTKEFLGFTEVVLEQESSSFRIRISGEFSGRQFLPEHVLMYYTRYQDKVITLCFLENR